MIASELWRLNFWCYFCNWAAGLLHGEILIIFSKDLKASSERSVSQQELVAKRFILSKQECVNKFSQACAKKLPKEFKLPASCQHLATKDTFYEKIMLLFHKAVITLCWPHFMQLTPLLLRWRHWVEVISFCLYGGQRRVGTPGIQWVEAKDVAKYLAVHRTITAPVFPAHNKEWSGPKCQ